MRLMKSNQFGQTIIILLPILLFFLKKIILLFYYYLFFINFIFFLQKVAAVSVAGPTAQQVVTQSKIIIMQCSTETADYYQYSIK